MRKVISIICISLALLSCKENKKKEIGASKTPMEEASTKGQWISLMDASKWRAYNRESLPGNWKIKDEIIECFGRAGDVGGDIISREQYADFELSLSWKISANGNSGIFYHTIEDTIYHSPYQTAAEYQILDDVGFTSPVEDWQTTGANYAMHIPNDKKKLNPIGEWNSTRIIFNKGKVEHWLNGEKIVEFDKFSEDWKIKRNSGKWSDFPDYGKANYGYIGLQDHGSGVWFKDVKIRKL